MSRLTEICLHKIAEKDYTAVYDPSSVTPPPESKGYNERPSMFALQTGGLGFTPSTQGFGTMPMAVATGITPYKGHIDVNAKNEVHNPLAGTPYPTHMYKAPQTGRAAVVISGAGDGAKDNINLFGQQEGRVQRAFESKYGQGKGAFFRWNDKDAIAKYINSVPANVPVDVYGHSYGGSTAAGLTSKLKRPISEMTLLDPVSRFNRIDKKPSNVETMQVVRATPSAKDLSDYIASLGGKWNKDIKDAATTKVNTHHNSVYDLFHAVKK